MSKSNGVKKLEIKPEEEPTQKHQGVVKVLKVLLADEAVLYTKLRNYHWNVTGANFFPLHAAFESQFHEIAEVGDVVAERIRQYGDNAIGTMDEFLRKTHLFEESGVYPDAGTMVTNLVADHETIIRFLLKEIEAISEKSGDVGVVDLLTSLLQLHEKMVWMLRMYLEEQTAVSEG
jgi:starvation-inducible DNA-binding protein